MGGGGKGGGGARTPVEQPNTLQSAQRLKIIDLLCEGVAGHDVSLKNIYLDNTPLQNPDGTYNFNGIEVSALPGTHNQDYLTGFDTTDKIIQVGAEVKASKAITRTITDPLIDRVRITLALGSLVEVKDNGDREGGQVDLSVVVGNKAYPVSITGKTTSSYHHDVVIDDLPATPFNIVVMRNTPDSTTDKVSNKTYWASLTTSIDAKFSYPNSVVVGLSIDSAQFGGKVPKRTYLNKWTQIKIPANYDPINRTYSGVWNGQFKTAWSNNPAWVFYDLVTDKRYGLGDRLGFFGCDKWSLYQIGKYCDQIVPDGFGGHEPRFTCNAYLSQARDAKALLDDLASVFRGIAVWDGLNVTALQDSKKDPVATYSNSNVVDGLFQYSGAAQKTIFTAVHVKFNDKDDGYATKTEYVADDKAIARYGLNVKQITAFGCTSRGQAVRVGKWLIETSIRERQMVSFKVGREGIRHLPFDIIEVADNDYAGEQIGGRVLSVAGNIITADRELSGIASIRYYADGVSKTVAVTAISGKNITLSEPPAGIEQLSVFSAAKTNVKPRLFRALGIKEDDGTYTINAVYHDENKEAIVDSGVTFDADNTATTHKPTVSYGSVSKDGDRLIIAWEGSNAVEYLIKVYRDNKLYQSYTQDSGEIRLKGLGNGEYRAEIRARSRDGKLSEVVIKTWTISYDIQGLKATPELFAIKLDWTNPATIINKAKIEIYRSETNDRATATKVATYPYPTDTFTQNGIKLSETHYFWLRLIDSNGNTGEWASVSGQCSTDTSAIVESINGKITKTELAQSLIDSLQSDIDTAVDAETQSRNQALSVQAQAQAQALTQKATELGTQISDVENVNAQQAQAINTVTTSQNQTAAGLETERQARIDGDEAEANARQTLAARVNNNKSSITNLSQTVSNNQSSTASQLSTLSSEVALVAPSVDNGVLHIPSPNGGGLSRGGAVTGAIKIRLPQLRSNTMLKFDVDIYYYATNLSATFRIAGYNHTSGWLNCTATIVGDKSVVHKVRFGNDGGRDCVWIGGVNASWSYLKVRVKDFVGGYSNFSVEQWRDGWSVSVVTVFDNVQLVLNSLNAAKAAAKVAADLSQFQTTQATKDAAQTTQLNQAKSQFNSGLATEKSQREAGDTANAQGITSANASITQLSQTVATANSATANQINELRAEVAGGGENLMTDPFLEKTTGTSANVVFGSNTCELKNTTGWRQGYVTLWSKVLKKGEAYTFSMGVYYTDPAENLVLSMTIGSVYVGSLNWAATTLHSWHDKVYTFTATSDDFLRVVLYGAPAKRLFFRCPMLVRGGAKGNFRASSTYALRTVATAGGRTAIAGVALGATSDAVIAESQVIVMADKFGVVKNASDGVVKPMLSVVDNKVAINGDLIASGTILGKHIKANQTISAPKINGGTLNINNRFKVDATGGVTISGETGNRGLKINNQTIEVYDANGVLRVKLGKLT